MRETLLWLALAGVTLAVGWLFWRRSRRAATGPGVQAQPGEIWWADVPYEDGSGHKVRPCLVLRHQRRWVDVLKITSQDGSDRRDHVEIPTQGWDRRATHSSFLDLSHPYRVRPAAFQRRAGAVDDATWRQVRQLHRTDVPA